MLENFVAGVCRGIWVLLAIALVQSLLCQLSIIVGLRRGWRGVVRRGWQGGLQWGLDFSSRVLQSLPQSLTDFPVSTLGLGEEQLCPQQVSSVLNLLAITRDGKHSWELCFPPP